jgi:hypothetical protein
LRPPQRPRVASPIAAIARFIPEKVAWDNRLEVPHALGGSRERAHGPRLAATTKRAVPGTARLAKSRTIESLRPSLGRKALAAFGTTTCENLLAASGQHTLAEAVAALADKAARLIRALHGSLRPNTLRLNPTRGSGANSVLFPRVRNGRSAQPEARAESEFLRNSVSYNLGFRASQRALLAAFGGFLETVERFKLQSRGPRKGPTHSYTRSSPRLFPGSALALTP